MKKVSRLNENDINRLVKKVIEEQQSLQKEVPISEILNKTVTFDGKCGNTSLGKIQLKIVNATHLSVSDSDGTFKALKFEFSKPNDKKGTKFRGFFRTQENEFIVYDNGQESVGLCEKGIINLTSENLLNYIKSLKKYPVGVFPNEKTKLPKTDFNP
jgi:hypothetical protein